MAYTFQLQKPWQMESRRLILLMLIIGSAALVFQFLCLPYASILLSVLPAFRHPVLGRSSFQTGDSSPTHVIVGNLPLLNDSNFTDSSLVPGVVKGSVMGRRTENMKESSKDPENDYASEEVLGQGYDSELDDVENTYDESSFGKSETLVMNSKFNKNGSGSVSTLEKTREPGVFLSKEEEDKKPVDLLSNDTLKSDISSALDKFGNLNTSVGSPSFRNLDLVKNLDEDSITSSNSSKITSNIMKKKIGGMPPISISQMNRLLFDSHVSSKPMLKEQQFSVRDRELLSAKLQIEMAPIIRNDPELHASVFRNISMFKRSYGLMERILKVYVYTEGEKPIFHQPKLKGIYASEGWFMKLMEANKKFVVKDPRKAHLFYLPFSSTRVRTMLHKYKNFHTVRNLAEYLNKYVDMIAAKYHFWNRTGGADHFLVASHDWAPKITRQHMGNCIRALCNSNVASGFKVGKDVSFPVTFVGNSTDPLGDRGGKSPSERPILAFFAGNMHGYLRPILLQYWENKDPEMKIFGPMPQDDEGKMSYIQHMKSSKYCICARGFEVHTPRVVEAIFYECVPVILSDNYVPPFFEVLDWEAFAVFIPEKDIPNLKNILLSIPEEVYLAMQLRVKKVQQHFLWHSQPVKYDIFHMTLHSIWSNRMYRIKPR
ncbi:PREDICTED: probable glycosyltransferase At5g03795 [Nelumbo nucifera]|uniref:Exostosin GT47 domain-containing protein n=2 Tax=Nelumbo nucifera TaxID=4432 RepID=A0A822ZIZ2_NELNU|nr:PREDICTED: probable glycosyltransferase At5g03795 [Nelumbo nucifera]DAD46064.1 TPA_asm: hypothetical protein HUJ06_004294 [Nelumbo nucifera]